MRAERAAGGVRHVPAPGTRHATHGLDDLRWARVGDDLAAWANTIGVTGSPLDAYLTLRGIRTLFVRVERQQLGIRAGGKAVDHLAGRQIDHVDAVLVADADRFSSPTQT